MMTTIEYCLNNVGPEVRNTLLDIEGSIEHQCLQRCGECYEDDFLVIDGDIERGDSHADLLKTTGATDT
jgi:uncharacterized protein YuzB (UPF0349 family)